LIVGIPGLRLLEPQAWIIGEDCRFDFQMTRQIPLEVHYPDDGDRKCGMSARGLEHMRRTFGTFINPRFSGNPKEAFGELPKTPLDLLIDLKKRIRKEDLDTWVEEVAALTGLKRHLDENPIAPMANKAGRGMSLQVPEFTWRDVLTALARKQGDLLEDWSHSGFGDEDFGYGALRNAKLLKGHGIFENRKPGGSGKGIAERIAYLLGEWKAQLQQPQQVSPSNSVPETSPPPTSDRADAPSSSARLSHTETPTHSDST
nr:hypothetical protein [Deltaproteobacteria bacterium]